MKKKKVFQSEKLNRIRFLERVLWLIPIGVFLYYVWNMWPSIKEALETDHTAAVMIVITCMLGFFTFLQSLIPFLILKIFLRKKKKQILRNSSFISMEDFDYYRDKLGGMSPGIISLLVDLQIEQKKDVAACILKYKEMGILKEEGNHYEVRDYHHANLRNSDRYLLEGLANGTFQMENDRTWKRLVEQEAMEEGYIVNKSSLRKTKREKLKTVTGCASGCLVPVVLFILTAVLAFHLGNSLESLERVLKTIPENVSLGEQLEYLQKYPECYPVIAEMILVMILMILTFISPILVIASAIATAFNISLLQRTEYGNQMAECVYGMKNFIHDFSYLSEADQEQVVLWDDYLVYAVVLEENQQIVNEIMKRRNRR